MIDVLMRRPRQQEDAYARVAGAGAACAGAGAGSRMIPDYDFQVEDRCDNPPRCNPDCLFRGTNADNVADKIAKGRQPRGEKMATNQRRKLSPAKVLLIQRRHAAGGINYSQLAREFGVLSHHTIRRAVTGESWSFVKQEGEI